MKPKFTSRASEMHITTTDRGEHNPISVTVIDEGAGPFIRIHADATRFAPDEERLDAVRLDFEEFHVVAEAVKRLEAEWADEPQNNPPSGGGGADPVLKPGGGGGGDPR